MYAHTGHHLTVFLLTDAQAEILEQNQPASDQNGDAPVVPSQDEIVGQWKVDVQKTNSANTESLSFHFGSVLQMSMTEMTIGSDGTISFYLGFGGGEGSYTFESDKVVVTVTHPETGQRSYEIVKVTDDETDYLRMTMDSGYQVYWIKV